MGAVLLDGKGLSREIEDDLKNRVEKLNNEGIEPHLAVILVGDDPASHCLLYTSPSPRDA